MKKIKNQQNWTYIILLAFITLGIIDYRFGVLGFLCILAPILLAAMGHGKIHCSKFCPRGSLLGKFIKYINVNLNTPEFMKKKITKKVLLIWMFVMFGLSLYKAFQSPNVLYAVGFAVFRMMSVSLAVAIIIGILFKPRTWCQVCPMGYMTSMIKSTNNNTCSGNLAKNTKRT